MCFDKMKEENKFMNISTSNSEIQITVIIPAYNCSEYVKEAVDSVVEQPYRNIDIIIVDDGSTDGTSYLVDELANNDTRIQVIHQENAGVSNARNKGIELALSYNDQGYIAFLDADDVWCKNALVDKVESFFDEENSRPDMIIFGAYNCNQIRSRYSNPIIHQDKSYSGGKSMIWKPYGHVGASLYSAKLIKDRKIRFFDGLKYSEDKIFQMQCVYFAQTINYSSLVLYCYRANRSSVMKKKNKISPINYYLPIINGWIRSDKFVNSTIENDNQLNAGKTLAGIYFMDMAAEHYKNWGGVEELYKIFDEHDSFYLFKELKKEDISKKQYYNKILLDKYPYLFKMKYNCIGIVEKIAKAIVHMPAVECLRDKKRYPLHDDNFNDI